MTTHGARVRNQIAKLDCEAHDAGSAPRRACRQASPSWQILLAMDTGCCASVALPVKLRLCCSPKEFQRECGPVTGRSQKASLKERGFEPPPVPNHLCENLKPAKKPWGKRGVESRAFAAL